MNHGQMTFIILDVTAVTDLTGLTATSEDAPWTCEASHGELIGRRLRELRSERSLSIASLARLAGLSAGLISQIERGTSNPSVKTLEKLRHALGANIWEFRDVATAPSEASFVRRADSRPKVLVGTNGFSKELLSPRNNNDLRFMILTLPPGSRNSETLYGPGDKGGYVIDGMVRLAVGGEVADLAEGDSFQFSSSLPHAIENPFAAAARVMWIISIRDEHL